MQRKGNPLSLLVALQTGAATLENWMEVPQKKRTVLWSSNCTTRYLLKVYKNTDLKGYMSSMFIATLSTVAKLWREPKYPSTDEWIKIHIYVCVCVYDIYTYTMEYHSAIKRMKSWHLQWCGWSQNVFC